MSPGKNIERLLERYVNGDLSAADRRLVEQYLESADDASAGAREDLKFEQALASVLHVEPFQDDVAGQVLERAFRRSQSRGRQTYQDGLAGQVLREALESGRLEVRPPSPFWTRRARRLAPAAAAIMLIAGAYWWHLGTTRIVERSPVAQLPIVGNVAYVVDDGARGSTPFSAPPRAAFEPLYSDGVVETNESEVAFVSLRRGGRIMLMPETRVAFRRDTSSSTYTLHLLSGGIRFDLEMKGRPVMVQAAPGYGGQIRGQGEVFLASGPLGARGGIIEPSLNQTLVVMVRDHGRATFGNRRERIDLGQGELGIVSPVSARKLPGSSSEFVATSVRRWGLDQVVSNPRGTALTIDQVSFTREDLAEEAMRTYVDDLVEMLVRSIVVEIERDYAGIRLPIDERDDARKFVDNEEYMQVAPLRSEAAIAERALQIAGLLAIAKKRSGGRLQLVKHRDVGAVCDQVWREMMLGVRLDRTPQSPDLAFRVIYRERNVDISRRQMWEALQRFLRVSEMETVISDFTKRHLLTLYLKRRQQSWPAVDWDSRADASMRNAQAILVRMSGLTMRQFWDRLAMQNVLLAHMPEPSSAEVDQYLLENMSDKRQVVFLHYFFPFGEPRQGRLDGTLRDAWTRSWAQASTAVEALRARRDPQPPEEAESRRGLWARQLDSGARPWWNEIYGPRFSRELLRLAVNEVSDPIPGPEGLHVVKLLHSTTPASDADSRPRAKVFLTLERARQQLDQIVAETTVERIPAVELLD